MRLKIIIFIVMLLLFPLMINNAIAPLFNWCVESNSSCGQTSGGSGGCRCYAADWQYVTNDDCRWYGDCNPICTYYCTNSCCNSSCTSNGYDVGYCGKLHRKGYYMNLTSSASNSNDEIEYCTCYNICPSDCSGACDGNGDGHACGTKFCRDWYGCVCEGDNSEFYHFGNWTTTVNFGKELNLTKIIVERYYVEDWSGFSGPPTPGVPNRAPDVSYKKPSDSSWSIPTNASEIVLSTSGSVYTASELQLRAEFERAIDYYGNSTTPVLEKITIHAKPRLHGVQTSYFQGYCWPVEESATYSTELIHINTSCTNPTQMCGENPCVIGYGVLNSIEYQENDTTNNFVSQDSNNYCWKGC